MKQTLDLDLVGKILSRPYRSWYVREIAEYLKVSPATASRLVKRLEKEGILKVSTRGKEKLVEVNITSPKTRALKLFFSVSELQNSGVIEYLQNIDVKSVILYGSRAKGVCDENSDFDIFVISKRCVDIDPEKIEIMLGKRINLICVPMTELRKFKKENKALYEEIMIYGFPVIGDKVVI